jgi:hypothetical protein
VVQRIKWLGPIKRIENVNLVKRITIWNYTGVRTKRQPKNVWRGKAMDDVMRNWSQIVRDRKA